LGIAWSGARWRRRLARLCAALAVAAIVVAATRPFVAVEPTGREGVLELVIDASGSMQAKDVAPTRLKATQRAALRLLDRLPPRLRVGLISFSATAGTQALPTTDRDALRGRIATLRASGSTAVDQGLQRALDDIRMSHPAAPAWMLLISDGTSLQPGNPAVAARLAAARRVQVLAVALGRPDATVTVRDPFGDLQRVPIPPDLFTLTRIASVTGGHAVGARSEPELDAALDDLIVSTGLDDAEQRDLTLLLAAAALLLLAIGRALTPTRPALGPNDRRPVPRGRWRQPVALLVAAGLATVTWTHWLPSGPSPASARSAVLAKLAAQPAPAPAPAPPPPPPAPPFVTSQLTASDAGMGGAGATTRAQQSNTDQQISFRSRWSSSTSSRIASGSCSRCHWHSSRPATSPSPSGAAARAALIA
jgi:Ca-activated chloride channel family protein